MTLVVDGKVAACQSCVYGRDWNYHVECRRYPPDYASESKWWPILSLDDWCGEYKPRRKP